MRARKNKKVKWARTRRRRISWRTFTKRVVLRRNGHSELKSQDASHTSGNTYYHRIGNRQVLYNTTGKPPIHPNFPFTSLSFRLKSSYQARLLLFIFPLSTTLYHIRRVSSDLQNARRAAGEVEGRLGDEKRTI